MCIDTPETQTTGRFVQDFVNYARLSTHLFLGNSNLCFSRFEVNVFVISIFFANSYF